MAISGGAAVAAALLQLGVYDPGETPSTPEQNDCLLILNQLLASWWNEQNQALQELISGQNTSGNAYVTDQIRVTDPIVVAFVLAGGTYTPPSYTGGSYTPGSVPTFPDLTTPVTFPEGYELAITLNGAVKLGPQYPGVGVVTDDLRKSAADALAAAVPSPGRVPLIGSGLAGMVPTPANAQQVPAPQP